MNRQLIIMSHPSGGTLTSVVLSEISIFYEKFGQEIVLRDLYKMGFNPVISKEDIEASKSGSALEDVLKEQKLVEKADLITFIYPVWWTGMPAIMKGYIDRVFCEGFAYRQDETGMKQPLNGKKVIIVNTSGKPGSPYMRGGVYDSTCAFCDKNIFDFLGMEVVMHYVLQDVDENTGYAELKEKIWLLKQEIKKSVLLANNSRLSIPNPF